MKWSLTTLIDFGCRPVVVVVPRDHVAEAAELVSSIDGVVVASGGTTRRESVANGLDEVGSATRVVIHDAARPFLSIELLERVVAGLEEADGAIAVVPVGDTLKAVDDGYVVETIDRARVWRAQTPQAFMTDILRRAHELAAPPTATDDAQLVEAIGGRVAAVRGDRRNLKITFDEDFAVAESMIEGMP